jgi:hypothetical protein
LANRVRLRQSASTRRGTLPHSEDRQSTARSLDLSLSLEQIVSDATPRTTLYGYVSTLGSGSCSVRFLLCNHIIQFASLDFWIPKIQL